VKVIVDLDDHDRIYFLQSRRREIHDFFAARSLSTALNPVEDHAAFNIREYRRPDRRFVLGTLMHQRDTDAWWYELVAGDTLDVPRTVRVFNAIRSRTWMGDRLRYHPVPPGHDDARADFVRAGVPVLSSDEIYAGNGVPAGEPRGGLRHAAHHRRPARPRPGAPHRRAGAWPTRPSTCPSAPA